MHEHDWPVAALAREFVMETTTIVCDTAPFLLVGFLLAGLLKVFIPERLVYRHLGSDRFKSVLLSSLYGVPVPLCSCSVIPTATSLRQAGASKGATASFLISTPETGVDSISVTYALLDPIMTVIRPVVAFVTAVMTGVSVNILVRRGLDGPGAPPGLASDEACCAAEGEAVVPAKPGLPDRLVAAVRYAFGPLFDDLTRVIIVGFVVSGLIATLLPEAFFTEIVPSGWPAMLLMLVVGAPLYICATASTPVAATLIAKGLDPGAALVFLLVGPATNVTTLLVVHRLLGRRILAIYLGCIAAAALAAGFLTDLLYDALNVDLTGVVAAALDEELGVVQIVGGVIFLLLLLASAKRIGLGSSLLKILRRSDDFG